MAPTKSNNGYATPPEHPPMQSNNPFLNLANVMTTKELIATSASQNAALLSTLAKTDYAAPALSQQRVYISDLNRELSQTNSQIRTLTKKREREFKDHEKYRDSTVRRFAYRLGGKKEKFQQRATKEEREYFDALHDEHKAKEHRNILQSSLDEAKVVELELEDAAEQNRVAQEELDALYQRVFEGPTPEFPEEDEKEVPLIEAQNAYNELQQRTTTQIRARELLVEATTVMVEGLGEMQSALNASNMDIWGIGGGFADVMERSALSRAQNKAYHAAGIIYRAREMDPLIGDVGVVKISNGNIWGDIVFDDIFSNLAFHEKIKTSQRSMQAVYSRMQDQVKYAKQREGILRAELKVAAGILESARKELQRVRQEAFERVLRERDR